jgi:hypothetical protein
VPGRPDPGNEEDAALGVLDVRAAGVDAEPCLVERRVREWQALLIHIVILDVEVHDFPPSTLTYLPW